MTEAEARAALEATGLGLDIQSNYVYSFAVPADDVISMTPPAGTLVPPGSTVTLLVSLGALPISISRWQGAQNPNTAVPLHEEAAERRNVVVAVFVDLDIPGDHLRLHNMLPRIVWGGNTWTGVGLLGTIEAVSETIEVLAQPLKLSLSGVEPSVVADIMNTLYHGSAVSLYVGLLDPDTYDLIDTPERVWEGFIDVMWIDVSEEQTVVRVDCEHRLRRQPPTSRYTDEDQRQFYPTDRFFDKLHLIPGYRGSWGSRDTNYDQANGRGGGGGHGRGHSREV